jgi:hypothetical protein
MRSDGRYGIEQCSRSDGEWMSCTMWAGFDLEDALAAVAHANSVSESTVSRVFDRETGLPVETAADTRGEAA